MISSMADIFLDFGINRMISFKGLQGFALEDLRSQRKRILDMIALLPVSLGNGLHRFLGEEDLGRIIPLGSFLLREDLVLPLDPVRKGKGHDRLHMFDIDFGVPQQPCQSLRE